MKTIIFVISFFLFYTTSFSQTKSYQLSSNILDVSTGTAAPNVIVSLQKMNDHKS